MKHLTVETFLGVVLAMPIIYWLRPLNAGAIALLLFLCVGVVVSGGTLFRALRRKGGRT